MIDAAEEVALRSLEFEVERRGGKFEFARGMSYGEHPSDMYSPVCAAKGIVIEKGEPIVFNLDRCYCMESAVFMVFIQVWLREMVASNPLWVPKDNCRFQAMAKALQEGRMKI